MPLAPLVTVLIAVLSAFAISFAVGLAVGSFHPDDLRDSRATLQAPQPDAWDAQLHG
jgi:hypothetical protein